MVFLNCRITAYVGKQRQSDADLSANTRPDLGTLHTSNCLAHAHYSYLSLAHERAHFLNFGMDSSLRFLLGLGFFYESVSRRALIFRLKLIRSFDCLGFCSIIFIDQMCIMHVHEKRAHAIFKEPMKSLKSP